MENENHIDVALLILAGCLGMLILVAFIVIFVVFYQKKVLAQQNEIQLAENKYQRQLLQATIEVEEKERERIAKNIHDDVGTLLNVLRLNLTKVGRNADNKDLTQSLTGESLKLLDESIQSIRSIAKDLVSPTLVKLGYFKAVHELCRHITNSGQVIAELIYDAAEVEKRFPEKTEVQLYRLTQELINNILKHAQAKELTVEYKRTNAQHYIIISHNGKGISSQEVEELSKDNKGVGLKSIQSRAQMIGGSVDYLVAAPDKASINIKFPL